MPNQRINSDLDDTWYAEVSWRRKPCVHKPGEDEAGGVCEDVADRGSAPGHVQIATVNVHSPFEFPEKDTGQHFEAGERFDGWRVTLDEAGIDRLIRTLHKAKRQAFGEPQAAIVPPAPVVDVATGETVQMVPRIIGDKPDPGGWIPTGTNGEGYWLR